MYNCKQIKDFILTDYIDGRLESSIQKQVEEHLEACAACKEFAREVKSQLVAPFKHVTPQPVPDHIWIKIQEKIQTPDTEQSSLIDAIRGWLEGFSFPRLVPVLGTMVILVAVGSKVIVDQQVQEAKDQEQSSYLSSVVTLASSVPSGGEEGTAIEQYFL